MAIIDLDTVLRSSGLRVHESSYGRIIAHMHSALEGAVIAKRTRSFDVLNHSDMEWLHRAMGMTLNDEPPPIAADMSRSKAIVCTENPNRCARIRAMNPPHFPMPPSVPAGMRLELSRAKLLPNSEKTFSDWMDWLHQEYEQHQQELGAERAVFESTFLHKDENGTNWIYHLQLIGDDSNGLDTANRQRAIAGLSPRT